jgi:hypothetical protein
MNLILVSDDTVQSGTNLPISFSGTHAVAREFFENLSKSKLNVPEGTCL